ncbi:MAG TPA: maleylpyruvate isomerase family mycothiol-dependent enzyme [Nocardioidaceae bacterium]|nr:maleylpyruvate isomerase family mycothiol-dependent enzyme [Nocardioidaceae bacterium]
MPAHPDQPGQLAHLDETAVATSRYLEALTVLTDEDARAPSLLPGWSRGHVVTHLARNADGLANLLIWARTGVETPQYPSWEQRNLDIDSGADRSAAELLEDSVTAADRFLEEASRMSGDAWDRPVRTLSSSRMFPARDVLRSRRTEVEVHHADLGTGYSPADWPADFTAMLIGRVQDDRADGPSMVLSSTDVDGLWKLGQGQGPEIRGTAADLAWWLIGRGDGAALVSSAGVLPQLPRWR